MKFENIRVSNFENAIRGMRNPLNSWDKSDSKFGFEFDDVDSLSTKLSSFDNWSIIHKDNGIVEYAALGPNDINRAQSLVKGGSEHRKFLRQIQVSVDITAPLYWYKEFDTYKVGTTANSTSTMHTLLNRPITLECFEISDFTNIEFPKELQREEAKSFCDEDFIQMCLIPYLEFLRQLTKELKEKQDINWKTVWKELVRWLPESWLQTRTITLNYENLYAMCHQRKGHKLVEWEDFINFVSTLPYANELIFVN